MRASLLILALALTGVLGQVASATVEFTPSPEHGTATLTRYQLTLTPQGAPTPSHTLDLGLPAVEPDGKVRLPLTLSPAATTGQTYLVALVAIGPGGTSDPATATWIAGSGGIGPLTNPRLVLPGAPGPPTTLTPGLRGAYFATMTLTGTPVERIDPAIDFAWGGAPGVGTLGEDTFSVRWTGVLTAPATATYTVYTQSDDGVRLWLGGAMVINQWIDQAETEHSATIALTAGQAVPITLEFYENGGNAVMRLLWSAPGVAKTVIPASAFTH